MCCPEMCCRNQGGSAAASRAINSVRCPEACRGSAACFFPCSPAPLRRHSPAADRRVRKNLRQENPDPARKQHGEALFSALPAGMEAAAVGKGPEAIIRAPAGRPGCAEHAEPAPGRSPRRAFWNAHRKTRQRAFAAFMEHITVIGGFLALIATRPDAPRWPARREAVQECK
jgi:hypothetical protein